MATSLLLCGAGVRIPTRSFHEWSQHLTRPSQDAHVDSMKPKLRHHIVLAVGHAWNTSFVHNIYRFRCTSKRQSGWTGRPCLFSGLRCAPILWPAVAFAVLPFNIRCVRGWQHSKSFKAQWSKQAFQEFGNQATRLLAAFYYEVLNSQSWVQNKPSQISHIF